VDGVTPIVLNWGTGGKSASGVFVLLDCGGGTATGSVLSSDGDTGSSDCGSCSTVVAQCSSDLGGTAPVFLNQHLRPSISRQEYQPVFGSPGALRQSIAHADEALSQQQTNGMTMALFMTSFANAANQS
jgi:hypothetical protein